MIHPIGIPAYNRLTRGKDIMSWEVIGAIEEYRILLVVGLNDADELADILELLDALGL